MNIWHKRILYIQIVLMIVLSAIYWLQPFPNNWVVIVPTIFMMLQVFANVAKAGENPAIVLYEKSCAFAILDFLSVLYFLVYLLSFSFHWVDFWAKYHIILFLYIVARKYNIIRNYSYII